MHISDLFKSFDQIRFRKTIAPASTSTGTQVALRPHHTFKCPVCDSAMAVSGESDLTEHGRAQVQLHEMECSCCGMMTERLYHSSKGYQATLIPALNGKL